jgi:L-ribulokinase
MSQGNYSIGLDFGTNSVRALLVDVATGEELAVSVWNFAHGKAGIMLDPGDPNLARQHPADYLEGTRLTIVDVLAQATGHDGFSPDRVIGIGVDTTGSTPIPVNAEGTPLALLDDFKDNLAAMAWLWKDHTGHGEATEITEVAAKMCPEYLAKCGGTYSSEWYWAKVLHCARVAPEVYEAAYTWVEHTDWLPAVLTDTTHPDQVKRGICAAGHKAMFNPAWGGYPSEEFLGAVDERLVSLRRTLPSQAYTVADSAGGLSPEWAETLGLPEGIPVAVGAFDAHLGGVGSGITPGTLVKNIGTSCCDMMVASLDTELPDIPGLCGIVPGSILPGCYGLEAGQSAVGDIFNWFVECVKPDGLGHGALTDQAEKLQPGESGLLALDWNNGNRTILVDQRLTGLMLGMTLHTTPAEMYRALIEATAFGARAIQERFAEYGVKVERIVNCGGISIKNPMAMQIYADVMGLRLNISRSSQTASLGSAMAGAVVAGKAKGGHDNFAEAAEAMTGVLDTAFEPIPTNQQIYDRLYEQYKKLHDSFGTSEYSEGLYGVMKTLLSIRDEVRN